MSGLANFATKVEIGWLVEVERDGVTYRGHVRSIQHTIAPGSHLVTIGLDPDRADRSWFTIGTSTIGGTDGLAF